mmetsp:Transcript_30290/g.64173  ORF Transcript_30290/g.64173 Transcript_30290/m.64173 type:complete len:228 (-) Transcript_30290:1151-1834(-)
MLITKIKRRTPHIPILVPLDVLLCWELGRVAPQPMRLTIMSIIILGLVNTHRIDFERHLASFHHVAKPGIERTGAFRIVTIITLWTPIRNIVGETPRARNGGIEDQITGLLRNLGSRGSIQCKVGYMQRVLPILSLAIPLNVGYGAVLIHLLVRLCEPIQPSAAAGLPFDAKGVRSLEMLGDQLLHRSHGIGLKHLVFITRHGFLGLGLAQIGSVEEGIEAGISRDC